MYLLIYASQGLAVVQVGLRFLGCSGPPEWQARQEPPPCVLLPATGRGFLFLAAHGCGCSMLVSTPEASLPEAPQKVLPDSFPSEPDIWDTTGLMSLTLHRRQLRVREGAQSHNSCCGDESGTQASPVFTSGLLCVQGIVGRTDSRLWREPLRAPNPQTFHAALPPGTRLCSAPTPFFQEVVESLPSRNQGEVCVCALGVGVVMMTP